MKVSAFTPAELEIKLRGAGIFFHTGGFITHLQTSFSSVAEGFHLLYADHLLASNEEYADFHVRLEPPANLRRWVAPQVIFSVDGFAPFKPLPRDQAFPMFEWGLNWCVSSHIHHYLIVHAAVVAKQGYAMIMPAPPGSGKSTLCAGLVNRGWRLLSDELTLIDPATGEVIPLPRPVSLKNQSIEVIRQFATDAIIGRSVRDTIKGTVAHMKPPSDSVAQADIRAIPAWIVFPKYQAKTPARLEPHAKARAFMHMAGNAFNYSLLGALGFNTLANVIERCSCYDFIYSSLDEAAVLFSDLKPNQA